MPAREAESYVPDPDNKDWSSKASLAVQAIDPRYADTVKEGPETVETFDLSDKEQLKSLNDLKAQAEPPGAPSILIVDQARHFCERRASYHVYISYRRMSYKQLVKRTNEPSSAEETARKEVEAQQQTENQSNDQTSVAA